MRRLKGSLDDTHPLEPDEVTALRRLVRQAQRGSVYLFPSARGGKMTPAAFRKQLSRIATDAGLAHLCVHPHMLRHSCGHEGRQDAVRHAGRLPGPCTDSKHAHLLAHQRQTLSRDLTQAPQVGQPLALPDSATISVSHGPHPRCDRARRLRLANAPHTPYCSLGTGAGA